MKGLGFIRALEYPNHGPLSYADTELPPKWERLINKNKNRKLRRDTGVGAHCRRDGFQLRAKKVTFKFFKKSSYIIFYLECLVSTKS